MFACGAKFRSSMIARRFLGPIATVWLVCHAATLTLVPALLWVQAMDASVTECTCATGADATCPMHHRTAGGSKVCVIQSLTTNATVTLNALFGIIGLVPAPPMMTAPVATTSPVRLGRSMATERPSPPDPPPPRA
jgi:hypothetical protein